MKHEHMRLRKGVWYLNLPIPADVQKFFPTSDPRGNPTGNFKTHQVESLKTSHVHRAKELKAERVA